MFIQAQSDQHFIRPKTSGQTQKIENVQMTESLVNS